MFILILVLALALSVGAAPAAAKAETFHYSTRGLTAYANFYSVDESGCIETYADLNATDGRVKQTGKPAVTSEMFVYMYQYDFCSGEWLVDAFGFASLAADEFVIDKGLNSATLVATINVYDYVSGSEFALSIDVTWSSTGGVYQQKFHAQYRSPEFKYNYRFMGTFRGATAAGSISGAGMEFAPWPASYAELANVKSGEVGIAK
jgi:hypothetical protein